MMMESESESEVIRIRAAAAAAIKGQGRTAKGKGKGKGRVAEASSYGTFQGASSSSSSRSTRHPDEQLPVTTSSSMEGSEQEKVHKEKESSSTTTPDVVVPDATQAARQSISNAGLPATPTTTTTKPRTRTRTPPTTSAGAAAAVLVTPSKSGNKGRMSAVSEINQWKKWKTATTWFTSKDLFLNNVGSVARDHLANERTFLAWLRTSLSLASIGVAITQLFRLSSSTYTLPSGGNGSTSAASSPLSTFLSPSAASSSAAIPFDPSNATQMAEVLSSLLNQVQAQSAQLQSLGTSIANEKQRYHQLGKPIGGTFIMLGLLFLYLGSHRYLSVQHHLTSNNYFPPARRSVLIASFFIGALLIAGFTSILVVQ